jgi:hypothetical protein
MKKSLLIAAASLLAAGSLYLAADEHYEKHYDHKRIMPVGKPMPESKEAVLYKNECSACHMAYQPGLLPKHSWKRVMTTMEDHFGTDATLEPADAATIAAYLDAQAYGSAPASKHIRRIAASVSAGAPMQITKAGYFVKEHRRIPQRAIEQNEVKSLANCNACHSRAESGSYREREIFIPNYGRWDD